MKQPQSSQGHVESGFTYPFPFQLMDVRLVELHAEMREAEPDEIEEPGLKIVILPESEFPDDDTDEEKVEMLCLGVHFSISPRSTEKAGLALTVVIEGLFNPVVEPDVIEDDVLDQFKNRDVLALLWPYMREVVHNVTERMRLSIPPLPVLDVRQMVGEENTKKATIS